MDKLQDVLKGCPNKYSLKKGGLKLDPIPALDVVHNPGVDPRLNILVVDEEEREEEEERGRGGYQPGLTERGSLRLDRNVVPLQHHRSRSEGWRDVHRQDFRYSRGERERVGGRV